MRPLVGLARFNGAAPPIPPSIPSPPSSSRGRRTPVTGRGAAAKGCAGGSWYAFSSFSGRMGKTSRAAPPGPPAADSDVGGVMACPAGPRVALAAANDCSPPIWGMGGVTAASATVTAASSVLVATAAISNEREAEAASCLTAPSTPFRASWMPFTFLRSASRPELTPRSAICTSCVSCHSCLPANSCCCGVGDGG